MPEVDHVVKDPDNLAVTFLYEMKGCRSICLKVRRWPDYFFRSLSCKYLHHFFFFVTVIIVLFGILLLGMCIKFYCVNLSDNQMLVFGADQIMVQVVKLYLLFL